MEKITLDEIDLDIRNLIAAIKDIDEDPIDRACAAVALPHFMRARVAHISGSESLARREINKAGRAMIKCEEEIMSRMM